MARPVLSAQHPASHYRRLLIAGFVPIVLFALGADSRLLLAHGFDGQILSNLAAPLYLLVVLRGLRPDQMVMALVFVPFSALGEYLFSLGLELYSYKAGSIPFYVPFGHAILFSTGLLIAELPVVERNENWVRAILGAVHILGFTVAILLLGDTLSALFGAVFVLILSRKGVQPFYLIMGLLVLYIELLGTAFGCWFWEPVPFGMLHATNPPVGAFVCYVIADILVIKIAWRLARLHPALAQSSREEDGEHAVPAHR